MISGTPKDEPDQILRYWWTLELFSPQPLPRLTRRGTRPEDSQVIAWEPGEPLPWTLLAPPQRRGTSRRRWRHTVYLGVYNLEDTYPIFQQAFGEDRNAYDERGGGMSACAGVLLDENGILMDGSPVLSSALWGVGQILKGPSARPDLWSAQFPGAGTAFAEAIDRFEGWRRETSASSTPLPQDEASLHHLLAIAHGAAELGTDNPLATRGIRISSVVVADRDGEPASADIDFLNSFYLDDLSLVARDPSLSSRGSSALAQYLGAGSTHQAPTRTDVIQDDQATNAGVSLERLPLGRWPSDARHSLALRQQFAVNLALNDLAGRSGLMGVNGPPGTGKTTMLRDILAGNVVQRAQRLASLPHPNAAFTSEEHRWTSADGYPRCVRQLRPELTGFEMVVTSANNAAVENVSKEIPARGAIAPPWHEHADYFGDIASQALQAASPDRTPPQVSEERDSEGLPVAWGLVAARLGSKRNRGAFRSAFWFDSTRPDGQSTAEGMQTRLSDWGSGKRPHPTWPQARARFEAAQNRVEAAISARRSAQARIADHWKALQERSALAQHSAWLHNTLPSLISHHERVTQECRFAESVMAAASQRRADHLAARPGFLETLFTWGKATTTWRTQLSALDIALHEATQRRDARNLEWQSLDQRRQQAQTESERITSLTMRNEALIIDLEQRMRADQIKYGVSYPSETWNGAARELRAPWLDAELDGARSDLFLAALQLHEDFLACAATTMTQSLRAAIEVVAGAYPRHLESEKIRAAWQTFFLVVPMVSTTFASFGRMFAGLGREALGWLLIDEAGQASPQMAVGALWRSQRAIAVGDPLQLQPIVTMPLKAQRDIAAAYNVTPEWIPPRASVQTLVDRVSSFGTTLDHDEESVWVSSPLTVHRRCDDPMFSLCNRIAYNDIMVSGVVRRPDSEEHPDPFGNTAEPRIAPSQWLHEPALTPGTHLQPNQLARLETELQRLHADGIPYADIIAISPFRAVADRLASLAGRRYPDLRAGTIHTAQGREAEVVFLVLGGDPSSPGAKSWASATVNLVNVAASRAKRRLYVIGDRDAWARYKYFRELVEALAPESWETAAPTELASPERVSDQPG